MTRPSLSWIPVLYIAFEQSEEFLVELGIQIVNLVFQPVIDPQQYAVVQSS